MSEASGEKHLRRAEHCCRDALDVLRQDHTPAEWAGAQALLGNVLETLGERGDDNALRESVTAYGNALRVFSKANRLSESDSELKWNERFGV
jgi:hypothetical protein